MMDKTDKFELKVIGLVLAVVLLIIVIVNLRYWFGI